MSFLSMQCKVRLTSNFTNSLRIFDVFVPIIFEKIRNSIKYFATNQKCSTLKFGCIIVSITKDCYLYFQGNYIVNTFIILLASEKC